VSFDARNFFQFLNLNIFLSVQVWCPIFQEPFSLSPKRQFQIGISQRFLAYLPHRIDHGDPARVSLSSIVRAVAAIFPTTLPNECVGAGIVSFVTRPAPLYMLLGRHACLLPIVAVVIVAVAIETIIRERTISTTVVGPPVIGIEKAAAIVVMVMAMMAVSMMAVPMSGPAVPVTAIATMPGSAIPVAVVAPAGNAIVLLTGDTIIMLAGDAIIMLAGDAIILLAGDAIILLAGYTVRVAATAKPLATTAWNEYVSISTTSTSNKHSG
jgi:hypothetical protein